MTPRPSPTQAAEFFIVLYCPFSDGTPYTDAFRALHAEPGRFTFWDYFRQAFENNRGIRIDHFLVSPSLRPRIEACEIDKGPRAQLKPSDHTPILLTLAIANQA